MIVAVVGEKGGTGKTTLATNLAGMRAAAGCDVLLVDGDRQGSASYWAEARDAKSLVSVTCVQKFGGGLARAIRDMARRYGDILIDIAAGDSQEIAGALRVARCALVPIQPAGLDMWTLGLIDDRVGEAQAGNPALQAWVVLNRASTNPRDNDIHEARDAMGACQHLTMAAVTIHERVAIKRAAPVGLTVNEYRPLDAKAAEEMARLYQLVFREGEEDGDPSA
jgi:chromosome partitioning protein